MDQAKRRALLAGAFGIALARGARAADNPSAIVQPDSPGPTAYMQRAFAAKRIAEQSGDQPYGAVVVKDGRIVGEAPSRVETNRDPTAHAETEAIRDAARRLGTADLGGCDIYATSRPCAMCEAACHWARIRRIFVGEKITDMGAPRHSNCR
jgi:tRNA(Arg) A34 adenosine deaminase TadA